MIFEKVTKDIRPFVIAGPCSAENEEQVLYTAQQLLQNTKIHAFRAGIWKPRTRPNSFEGVGEIGLTWLKKVKETFDIPVITEVANSKHVELALKYNIDWLWLGARTTVNPFSVQEIADSLKGLDIPIFIKNPINPDLNLWIGAIERIYNAGIKKIVAIHRGFSSFNKTQYRNDPMWSIPIELKRIFPDLEMLCDPSHIAGSPNLLLYVAQKAMDLEMNGIMIEVHYNPKKALSDAEQQITPRDLQILIQQLVIRKLNIDDELEQQIQNKRKRIDELDAILLEILSERMKIIQEIGWLKKNKDLTVLQIQRWGEVLKDRLSEAQKLHLNSDFIKNIYEIIHEESIQIQVKILNEIETLKNS
jgi:chorismate mutase